MLVVMRAILSAVAIVRESERLLKCVDEVEAGLKRFVVNLLMIELHNCYLCLYIPCTRLQNLSLLKVNGVAITNVLNYSA